jgi:anti-anti-sigma factor
MSLQLEQYQHGGVTVIRLVKDLKGEPDADYLLVILDQLIASEKNRVLLNLRELTGIDSAGLGALAEAHLRIEKAGGTIKIVNAAQRHTDLLILSNLAAVLPSFNDEETALKSFESADGVKRFDILEFVREMNEEEQQQNGGNQLHPGES